MSAEVKNALLIAAPGSWSNKARVSSVTPRTKSVDLISRGIILQYQARAGCCNKMTQGQEARVMCLPPMPIFLAIKCEYC